MCTVTPDDAPANHYDLQCSSCHITDNWVVVDYLHNEAPFNCLECHETPEEDHYLDNCIVCHNVTDWSEIIFEHSSDYLNCSGCHVPPPGHWPGQCWYCHKSTSDWTVIVFDHSTYTDCKSCHADDRPADHPRGQCSMCHTTDTWDIPDTPTPWPTSTPRPTLHPDPDAGLHPDRHAGTDRCLAGRAHADRDDGAVEGRALPGPPIPLPSSGKGVLV